MQLCTPGPFHIKEIDTHIVHNTGERILSTTPYRSTAKQFIAGKGAVFTFVVPDLNEKLNFPQIANGEEGKHLSDDAKRLISREAEIGVIGGIKDKSHILSYQEHLGPIPLGAEQLNEEFNLRHLDSNSFDKPESVTSSEPYSTMPDISFID